MATERISLFAVTDLLEVHHNRIQLGNASMGRQIAIKYVIGFAMAVGATTVGAHAAPIFTVTPGGASPALNGPAFQADTINISDFSTITYGTSNGPSTVSFTDQGFLDIINFQIGSNPSVSPALNTQGGYGMFFSFNATGTQSVVADSFGNFNGSFNTLSYTLYGYNQTAANPYLFNAAAPITTDNTNGNPVATALATGSLTSGNVTISRTGVPSASVGVTFTALPGEQGVFSSPNPFYNGLGAAFINLANQAIPFPAGQPITFAPGTGFVITNGGGSANFIPEPATIGVFGLAIASLMLVRRRQLRG